MQYNVMHLKINKYVNNDFMLLHSASISFARGIVGDGLMHVVCEMRVIHNKMDPNYIIRGYLGQKVTD